MKTQLPQEPTQTGRSQAYSQFCEQVYGIVRSIPLGRVTTYGGIAVSIPQPEGMDPLAYKRIRARWVGYALKACPPNVPWWRVVNAQGRVSKRIGHSPQIQPILLKEEGVPVEGSKIINLEQYLWKPST